MIEMRDVRAVVEDAIEMMKDLDGVDHQDGDAVTSQSKGDLRKQKAQTSQDLLRLAARLDLAAELVRNEYWFSRSGSDPLHPNRR